MQRQLQEAPGEKSGQHLEAAFRSFALLSNRLADAYEELQGNVAMLQRELESVSDEKSKVSREKARIGGRLDGLLELLPAGVVLLNAKGRVERYNNAAVVMLGDTLQGCPWGDIIRDCFRPRADDGHEVSLVDGRRVSIATASLADEQGQIILLNDLTETRELQDRFARQERLTTMGKMVAHLAHQIRTPLASAMLYASQALDEDGGLVMRQLHAIEKQISDLLIFAKGVDAVVSVVPLTDLLGAFGTEIGVCSQHHLIDLRLVDDAPGAMLQCNFASLLSALMNLVNNACEAALESGAGRVEIRVSARMARDVIHLRVADNGPGLPAEQKHHLLEPFVSTRPRGTGLGLSVVQSVTEALGGVVFLGNNCDVPGDHPASVPGDNAVPGAWFELQIPGDTLPAAGNENPSGSGE